MQVNGTGQADSAIAVQQFSAGVNGPTLRFAKSRAAAIGTYTIVQDGDILGSFMAYGADGTDMQNLAAQINSRS